MSMNLRCQAVYPDGATVPITLLQTTTSESWKIIGCAQDFSNHQGAEPYLTRYCESMLVRLVLHQDTKYVPTQLAAIRSVLDSVAEAVAKGATIEWYVI